MSQANQNLYQVTTWLIENVSDINIFRYFISVVGKVITNLVFSYIFHDYSVQKNVPERY